MRKLSKVVTYELVFINSESNRQ